MIPFTFITEVFRDNFHSYRSGREMNSIEKEIFTEFRFLKIRTKVYIRAGKNSFIFAEQNFIPT